MRSYPCQIVGINYEGRADYIESYVREGDELVGVLEPDNHTDPKAVAVYHNRFRIGYIAAEERWVGRSIAASADLFMTVDGIVLNEDDYPIAMDVTVAIMSEGLSIHRPQHSPPPPSRRRFSRRPTVPMPQKFGLFRAGLGLLILLAGINLVAFALEKFSSYNQAPSAPAETAQIPAAQPLKLKPSPPPQIRLNSK